MTDKHLRAFSRALWDSDLVASRLTLFAAELLWALMLFWPGETFGRPTYGAMAAIAPEWLWACVYMGSAIVQLRIVTAEAFHERWARWFAGWNAALWLMTVGGMLMSVYPPPAAIGGEIALSALAAWIFARPYFLAMMYRQANERYRNSTYCD